MLRGVLSALSARITFKLNSKQLLYSNGAPNFTSKTLINQGISNFTSLVSAAPFVIPATQLIKDPKANFLEPQRVSSEQIRTVTKVSWKKAKRKSVYAVVSRFYRLNWGIWIRTKAGRHKHLWKKSRNQRNRLLHHVFCNATQCRMLDTMVNKYWRKPKYYIESPYEVYHKRENFYITQTKPWRPEGVDYE